MARMTSMDALNKKIEKAQMQVSKTKKRHFLTSGILKIDTQMAKS